MKIEQQLPSLDQIQAEKCKRHLKDFVKTFWHVLEPSAPFQDDWYIDAICLHLENILTLKRLLINLPPRHTKSLITSVFFPAWQWLHDPTTKFLCCSYALTLSKELSMKCRRLIESPLYQQYYGHLFKLEGDQNTQQKFETSKRGYRQATSVESGNIGAGGDIILFDDPNDVAQIYSKAERDKVTTFWRETLSTRMNYTPGKSARIVIQQRCHPDDLSGYILDQDMGEWTKLVLPYEFDPERRSVTSLWADPRTNNKQRLSSRIPEDEREIFKREKGSAAWEALYNQNPRPASGAVFQQDWFKLAGESPTQYHLGNKAWEKSNCWRLITVDLAISQKDSADWTVFAVVDITPQNDMIVAHLIRDRMEAPKILATFFSLYDTWQPSYMIVESSGAQEYIIQQLRAGTAERRGIPVRGIRPTTDKRTRAIPLEVRAESGKLYFLDKDWLPKCERELLEFPNSKNDDQVDALAYAASEVSRRPTQDEIKPQEKTQEQIDKDMVKAMWADPEPEPISRTGQSLHERRMRYFNN